MNFLKSIWKKWLTISRPIGNFQAQILFSLFYLLVLSAIGIAYRLLADPLRINKEKALKKASSNFQTWEHDTDSLEQAEKQY